MLSHLDGPNWKKAKSGTETTKEEAKTTKRTPETDSRQIETVQEPKDMTVEELSNTPTRKTRRVKSERGVIILKRLKDTAEINRRDKTENKMAKIKEITLQAEAMNKTLEWGKKLEKLFL